MITKDEKVITSPAYLGYLILKRLRQKEDSKVMVHEIADKIREEVGIISYRQFFFALMFLYQAEIVDFAEPYVYKK